MFLVPDSTDGMSRGLSSGSSFCDIILELENDFTYSQCSDFRE